MGAFDPGVKFSKTGCEAKAAIAARLTDLGNRLALRNSDLESLMNDKTRLRSFLVRGTTNDDPHNLQAVQESPSEDHQQINELCKRINRIEKEMAKLSTIRNNLKDDQQLELDYDELLELGFGPRNE